MSTHVPDSPSYSPPCRWCDGGQAVDECDQCYASLSQRAKKLHMSVDAIRAAAAAGLSIIDHGQLGNVASWKPVPGPPPRT